MRFTLLKRFVDVADAQAMLYAGLASDGDTMNRLFQQALRTLENSKHVHVR